MKLRRKTSLLFITMILFSSFSNIMAVSAISENDAKCSFSTIQTWDLICVCVNGNYYHSVVKEKLPDKVILFDHAIGEYVLTPEDFDKACLGKEFEGETMTLQMVKVPMLPKFQAI